MSSENFKLIILSPEKDIPGEAPTINRLFEAGLEILHIRKHDHTRQEVKNLISAVQKDFHPRIVLHQHYELLDEFDLKGAHLTEHRRKEGRTFGIKNIISTSYHKLGDITREKVHFEYALLSPIFKSISKKSHVSKIEIDTLQAFFLAGSPQPKFPIIALGGINELNIIQAKEIGFSGAACIGYIWENPQPVEQFKKLQKIIQG